MKAILIKSEQQRRYCETRLKELPLDGSQTVVFKKTDKSSTGKQRRLQWLWCTEVANSGLGQDDTKDAVHIRAKWKFALPILLRDLPEDDIFIILYNLFIKTITPLNAHEKAARARAFADQYISTEKLTRRQRAEYLTEFQRFWIGQGVDLTDPAMRGVDLERWYQPPCRN